VDLTWNFRNYYSKLKPLHKLLSLAALIWLAVRYANDFAIKWKDNSEMINQIGIMQLVALSAVFVFSLIGIIAFLMDSTACLMMV
jgi:hypothetical protein